MMHDVADSCFSAQRGKGRSIISLGIAKIWEEMVNLEEFVQAYRRKLGTYDTKPWELAVDSSVSRKKSISEVPRRPAKPKWNLIDVDLVRGSTFPKEKSQLPWTFFSRQSISRVILLPFEGEWWTKQSSPFIFTVLRILYTLQCISLVTWFINIHFNGAEMEGTLFACETLTPVLLMLIVAEILTQAEKQETITRQLESISDDTSVDFDDLASLSDRSSDCGRSPSRASFSGKLRRRIKRRPSRLSNPVLESAPISANQSRCNAAGSSRHSEESIGFLSTLQSKSGLRQRRSLDEAEETADSGLFCSRNSTTQSDRRRSEPFVKREDDLESDVSDSELRMAPRPAEHHISSGKESSDEECAFRHSTIAESRYQTFDLPYGEQQPDQSPLVSLSSQVVGCTLFEGPNLQKADLSLHQITTAVIKHVERNLENRGAPRGLLLLFPTIFSLLPIIHSGAMWYSGKSTLGNTELDKMVCFVAILRVSAIVQRFVWGFWFFLLLVVAYQTYQQRYLVAKYFGYLTSSRRAERAGLPHFRLSKVRNVKSWLGIRSFLKKYGPRKSVDVVVSFCCISCLVCVIFTCFMVVNAEDQFTSDLLVWESMLWLFAVGIFLLRFIVLGSKTNQKFRNSSVLTTEQLNLYLKMEQKPHKKEQLMLVNNVLKLAADLIKEIEHPCRISGFPANPFLYNVSRLLILSAFSTLVSEICGFKLKLHKLKI